MGDHRRDVIRDIAVYRIKTMRMKRIEYASMVFVAGVSLAATLGVTVPSSAAPYEASWESMAAHREAPEWSRDAKLGIYFPWGAYTMPKVFGQGPTRLKTGGHQMANLKYKAEDIRFTRSKDNRHVFVTCFGWPEKAIQVAMYGDRTPVQAELVGSKAAVETSVGPDGTLTIHPPRLEPSERPCQHTFVFKISAYEPYIPEDKGLDPDWISSLSDRGERKVYRGGELELIAMPCGGIGAGQVEITGDGRLCFRESVRNQWQEPNAGHGLSTGYQYLHPTPVQTQIRNGFAIRVTTKDGRSRELSLDGRDFDDLRFVGEYPVARLDYRRRDDPLPVRIRSEVFSPFVPLNVRDSANPVTSLRFTLENTSDAAVTIDLGGWLENACDPGGNDQRANRVFWEENLTGVQLGLASQAEIEGAAQRSRQREALEYDTFENVVFGGQWNAEGEAFGGGSLDVHGTRFNHPLRNYQGKGIATSFQAEGKEDLEGKLVSEPFKIKRDFISFRIGGGNYRGATCINLLVDPSSSGDFNVTRAKVVRTATGSNSNTFDEKTWNVADLEGQTARLEVVDRQKGRWAFVMVDDIAFVDAAPEKDVAAYGDGEPGYGNLAISVLDGQATASAGAAPVEGFLGTFAQGEGGGAVTSTCTLAPGETRTVAFFVSWYFPNLHEVARRYRQMAEYEPGRVGRIYDNWYGSAADVARWTADHYARLFEQTERFRATYHDTTLPYWLVNRISMPVSTLAAANVSIWRNGRMYAYEGVGFCPGTCGHVYNFVTAISKLFPELERSVRLKQDFSSSGPYSAYSQSGRINFRGYGVDQPDMIHSYASDAQSGYVLKAYREHLMSPNGDFLHAVWEQVKGAIGYQIYRDGAEIGLEPNGVLEGEQTFWDPMWYGPNPYNNTLYLAALRAAEEMARVQGEEDLAKRYRGIFEKGRQYMEDRMWNGEYYMHLYPPGFRGKVGPFNGFKTPEENDKNARGYVDAFNRGEPVYVGGGCCDAQQLFGQNWAHQLGLGDLLLPERCRTAAAGIFKYNWTPDISLVYDLYPSKSRTLAAPGEGALVNGAWPTARRQRYENTHDKDDVWTGLEYDAACNMINAGLVEEALIVLRAIHDRYDAAKRNPWNEIEGSDHYSRAMQVWNVLLALSGFTCDGPAGRIGFGPRLTPERFKSFFSAAEGWGTYEQTIKEGRQVSSVRLEYGRLRLEELELEVPEEADVRDINLALGEHRDISCSFEQVNRNVVIQLAEPVTVEAGDELRIELR